MAEKRIPSAPVGELYGGVSRLTLPLIDRCPAPQKEDTAFISEKWIASSQLRELCAGISDMTLWRWLNDADMGFPKPTYIAKRRYWRYGEVIAWLEAQASKAAD